VEPANFFASSRLLIVAGKGGVGKTAVSVALARAASSIGLDTLLIEVEGKSSSTWALGGQPLDYADRVIVPADAAKGRGTIRGRVVTPDEALIDYLEDHGMRRIARRLASTGTLEIVAAATPGIKDILVLGKVKQLETAGTADLIILDAPASGHAISFLRAARQLLDTARSGPIHTQAREVQELLSDPTRCQVLLVTLPEETPVNELVETAYSLEDQVGVRLGPLVVNGLYPVLEGLDGPPADAAGPAAQALAAAAALRSRRQHLQAEQVERLSRLLPLEQLRLPHLFVPSIGPDGSTVLADALLAAVRALPDRVLHD